MAGFPNGSSVLLAAALALVPLAAVSGVMDGGPLGPPPQPEPVARSLTLPPGYATVYRFDSLVETVVVGNSAVVGTSVLDPREIVLTALAPGRTNVIVLGADGRTMARLFVRVREEASETVKVYNGASRTLLVCEPECLPVAEAPDRADPPPSDAQ